MKYFCKCGAQMVNVPPAKGEPAKVQIIQGDLVQVQTTRVYRCPKGCKQTDAVKQTR
jgi:hypothetical protein